MTPGDRRRCRPFLIDESVSPTLCTYLTTTAGGATHVRDVTGTGVTDAAILDVAQRGAAVGVTADTEFGTLLARSRFRRPSVVLVCALLDLPVAEQGRLLAANLDRIRGALEAGAIIVIAHDGIQVHPLPIT